MKINEKIYSLRKEKGLSQEELANKLNVSRQTVSKWETGESNPDFDKIVPLCELFGITTEELLRDRKIECLEEEKPNKKKAMLITISIIIYFAAISFIVFGEETLNLNDGILVSGFLMLIAIATGLLIYTCMTMPSKKDKEEKDTSSPLVRAIIGCISMITTAVYLLISFLTHAWHITWIIWIIYAIIVRIIKLIFELKESEKNEEN